MIGLKYIYQNRKLTQDLLGQSHELDLAGMDFLHLTNHILLPVACALALHSAFSHKLFSLFHGFHCQLLQSEILELGMLSVLI